MNNELIVLGILILASGIAAAEEPAEPLARYVVDFTTDALYVYDEEVMEIGRLTARDVKSQDFEEFQIEGETQKGLRIHDENAAEGLVKVQLSEYPDKKVWLESMAVKIKPDNQLSCPKIAQSQQKVANRAMTIGFGEHCSSPKSEPDAPAMLSDN